MASKLANINASKQFPAKNGKEVKAELEAWNVAFNTKMDLLGFDPKKIHHRTKEILRELRWA